MTFSKKLQTSSPTLSLRTKLSLRMVTSFTLVVFLISYMTCSIQSSVFAGQGDGDRSYAAGVQAQIRIGVVDLTKIIESSKAYKDIVSQIEAKSKIYREATEKQEQSLKKMYQELEAQKNVLAKEKVDEKASELNKKLNLLQENVAKNRETLDQGWSGGLQKIVDTVKNIIQERAKKEGFDIIIDKSSVVYSKNSIELTDTIQKALDANMSSVKVNLDGGDPGIPSSVSDFSSADNSNSSNSNANSSAKTTSVSASKKSGK